MILRKSHKMFVCWVLASLLLVINARAATPSQTLETEVVPSAETELHQELLNEAISIDAEIKRFSNERSDLERTIKESQGDTRYALELEHQQRTLAILELLFSYADNLYRQEERQIDTADLRDTVVAYTISSSNALDDILDKELEANLERRSTTDNLQGFELIEFERSNAEELQWTETLFKK